MRLFLSKADRKARKEITENSGGLCQIFPALRSKDSGKKSAAELAESPPRLPGKPAEAHTGEAAAFLEQDSTTVPKFA